MAPVWLPQLLLIWFSACLQDVQGCSAFEANSLIAHPDQIQEITSPNYPKNYHNNVNICWKIKTSMPNYHVMLETTKFEVEYILGACEADYVDVRNGYYDTSPLLRRLCGTLHINLTSSSQYMFINFRSDESITLRGFLLRYWSVPEESVVIPPDTSRDGCKETSRLTSFETIKKELVSPRYPESYPPSLDKCWQLEALDTDKVILLEVLESTLEESYSCTSGDFVEARDGTDTSDRLLKQWCGDDKPEPIMSTGPFLLLRFHTDQTANNFPGFRIHYSTANPPSSPVRGVTLDSSAKILIGVAVAVMIICGLVALLGYHKKVAHGQSRAVHPEAHDNRRRSSVSGRGQHPIEDTRVRLAFEAILRRPSENPRISGSAPSNLQAPPPYEATGRPPSHLGFMAPQQPGYVPWSLPSKRPHRRRRQHGNSPDAAITEQSIEELLNYEVSFMPGTPVPTEPPPYEDLGARPEDCGWTIHSHLTIQTAPEGLHGSDSSERVETVSESMPNGDQTPVWPTEGTTKNSPNNEATACDNIDSGSPNTSLPS